MKKITTLSIAIITWLMMLNLIAAAYSPLNPLPVHAEISSQYSEFDDTATRPVIINEKYTNNISIDAVRNFAKNFSNATHVIWRVTDFGGSVAEFSLDSMHCIVTYSSKGDWLHTVKKYNERQMPPDIRHIIKRTYYDYTIMLIDEINCPQNEKTVFLVYLQDEKSLKTVRVYDGEMELVSDLERE